MSSEMIVRWLEGLGQLNAQTAGVLALAFVIAAFIPVPRTIVVVGAGAAFGMKSLVVIVPSTTLGCMLAFLLARYLLRNLVAREVAKRRSWHVIAQAVDDEGWWIVALMRFWGPLPNFVQNYLFGLTRIGLLPFTVITLLFTLPQIVFYTYLGASGRAMLLDDGPVAFNLIVLGIAATTMIAVLILVSKRAKVILNQQAELQGN
jgi:uncharacterized membrane protein YdjX (TVP38/TMEM64 family)